MSKLHEQRWDAACKLFVQLVYTATYEEALILYDDSIIDPSQVVITDSMIYVKMGNMRFIECENESNFDCGLHHTIEDFKINMLSRFSVVKKIKFA